MPSEKRARQRAYREQKLAAVERRKARSKRVRRGIGALVVVGIVVGIVAALSGGSSPKKQAASSSTTTLSPRTPTTAPVSHVAVAPTCPRATAGGASRRVIVFTKAPPSCVSPAGIYDATVRTDVGNFVVRMPAASSLAAVNSFVFLARYHYFDGTVFHRVIPGFVVQGGDPTGSGSGGPGYSFTGNTPPSGCSAKKDCYPLGTIAVANSGSPSSDGSQFFVVVGASGETLQPNYTVFGKVVSGMPVVQRIAADGNSDPSSSGVPPRVLHHIVKITIRQVKA